MINRVSNSQSFCAVNQKFLKMAQDEHKIMNTVSGDLIEGLQYHILTKKISPQDGIDTIEAIKPYTKQKYHKFFEPIIETCKNLITRSKKLIKN